jgi:hypothetical protein
MGAILLLPSLFLATSGIVHLLNGLAVNAAFPVPLYLSLNRPMPRAAYADAADVLSHANIHDGDTQLSLAEARFYAGEQPYFILNQVEAGLVGAPASAEGWAFYAEVLARTDPNRAAQALDEAFTLAPYDFFWAGRRAQLASQIWNSLGSDTKDEALRQTRTLWEEPMLRDEILPLLATSDGEKLLTRAFASDPDTLRDINRWVSARRRQSQPEKP